MTGTSGMTALVGGLVLVGVGFGVGYVVGGGGPAVPVTGTALDRPAASGPSVPPLAKLEGAPVPAARLESERAAAVESLRHVLDALPLPEVERGTGVITGTILTDEGAPLAGVEVSAVPSSMPDEMQRGRPQGEDEDMDLATAIRWYADWYRWRKLAQAKTTTGADGRYRIEGLVDGAQRMRATLEGWSFRSTGQNAWQAQPGETLDFVASPSWAVHLDVVLPDGSRPSSAMGTYQSGSSRSATHWSPDHPTWGMAPGTYEVTVTAGDFQEFQSKPITLTVPRDGPGPDVRIDLEGHPVLKGRVVWPPGERMSNTRVRLARIPSGRSADPALLASSTQEQSLFRDDKVVFSDLTPGPYIVGMSRTWSGPIVVSKAVDVGSGVAEVELEVPPLTPEQYVALRILDPNGKPLTSNVQVQLMYFTDNGSRSQGGAVIDRPDGEKWVLLDGSDEGLEKGGRHWLAVTIAGYGSKRTEFEPGSSAPIEVRFDEPGSADVQVSGLAGTAYDGRVTVQLTPAKEGEAGRMGSYGAPVKPGGDGRASLVGVQPGDYELWLSLDANRGASGSIASKPVSIHAGSNPLAIAMPALYEVTIEGLERSAWMSLKERKGEGFYRSVQPTDGRAVVDGLPAGTYTVRSGAKSADFTVPGTSTVHL